MVSDKFKQLADYQHKVAALQRKIERERAKALASLHRKYGFGSPAELIRAIRAAAGAGGGKRAVRAGAGHRKYARISPELRQKIKAALQAGKTGGAVAAAFGVSVPSVYNIKKASGLVKARKGK